MIPFCDTTTLTFAKRRRHYKLALVKLGDHCLRRLDLVHTRKYAASQIGLDPESLKNREGRKTAPAVRFYPRLIDYLGYTRIAEAKTGGRESGGNVRSRDVRKALAEAATVDEATIKRMEEGVKGLAASTVHAICRVLYVEI